MNEMADLAITAPDSARADLLLLGVFEDELPGVDGLPTALAEAAKQLADRPGWKARKGRCIETSVGDQSLPIAAIALRGLGKRDELDRFKLDRWLQSAIDTTLACGLGRLALRLPDHETTRGIESAERVLRQLRAATYRFRPFLAADESKSRLNSIQLLAPSDGKEVWQQALGTARAVADGMELSRTLGNTPGNIAQPEWMEQQARELAELTGATLTVLDAKELEKRGMNGMLAVGNASKYPPRIVRLDLGTTGPCVALVGKGITFDTGGISLKPSAAMEEMKFDKCGATTVLGVVRAVADLKLPIRLRAYLALAENMPGGSAYRPGDILRCYNGKSVEIINTDAEGRIVLADTLAWAVEDKPDWLLEFSTLTGACVIALGPLAAGIFTPSDQLADGLLAAAERSGERLWRLPYWPEHLEPMRGNYAELKNTGGRWGAACTAAAFLGQFVDSHERWAHIDIAGPCAVDGKGGGTARGATGYSVPFTVDWLRTLNPE